MSAPIRIAHGIMATLFAFSALIQFNDPSPLVWILLYLFAAGAAGLAATNKIKGAQILGGLILIVVLIWEISYIRQGAWRVPFMDLTKEWHMTSEQIVLGREFYALIWIGGWMAVVTFNARNAAKRMTS